MEAHSFDLQTSALPDGRLVTVRGELDMATASQLGDALQPNGVSLTYVDVSELTFIDSSGLRALIGAAAEAQRSGGALRLRGTLQPIVERTFHVSGADRLLEFV